MGTILAKAIVTKSSSSLNDSACRRWSAVDLLEYLNDGQREIGIYVPAAITVIESVPMVAGSMQALPATGIRVVDAICNTNAGGTTQGSSVRVCEREVLDDSAGRSWRNIAATAEVEMVTFDGRYPTVFQVYPPQSAPPGYILLAFQKAPTDCTINGTGGSVVDSVITLNDVYATALHEYILHRAYHKETDAQDENKSARHYGTFLQRLGLKKEADRVHDLNRNAPPAQQSRRLGGVSPRAKSD